MPTQIFVNLAVRDLPKSVEFFTALGYTFNAQFTNDAAACLIIDDRIHAMLLTYPFFKGFIPTDICDSTTTTEALIALTCESRAAVDEIVRKAVAAGGKTYKEPQDHGFMYGHSFRDPDGHIWEYFYMDPSAAK